MGQAKAKHRDCPVIGRRITGAECGANRASRYACPADCLYYPWSPANYARALEIEDQLTAKLTARVFHEADDAWKDRLAVAGLEARQDLWMAKLYRERDGAGRTFLDRWAQAQWAGLNNDQHALLGWHAQMRITLTEVHHVRDTECCEGVDLFAPTAAPLVIHDRQLAAQAVRFSQVLGWTFPMPHYHRVHGAALPVPEVSGLDGLEIVRIVVAHLGGPTELPVLRDWLADHLPRVGEVFAAITAAFRWRMIESASAKFSRATYRVTGALNEILRRLTNLPQVSADDLSDEERAAGFTAAYAWFDEPAALERGQSALALPPEPLIVGRPVLGRVLIGDGQVCVEAGTTNRYQALRAQFEARVGRLVTFTEERVDDFGARLLEREPQPDFSRVPPALLARAPEMRLVTSRLPAQSAQLSHAEITARSARQMHERFLDQPVPLLNDHTPRQAAADPLLRPVLLTLMKSFVRAADQNNLRTGQSEDLNWMLRELNLPEIIFDPPPPRPATQKAEETDEADDIFAPPVAGRRMSEAEVRDRLVECQNFFISPVEMLDEFEAEVPELVEWIDDFAGESVNDEEWEVLLAVAAQVWYTYHPPGALATGWDLRQFLKFVDDEAARALAEDVMASVESFAKYLGGVRQPVLFGVLSAVVIKTITAQSQDASPRVGSEVAMLQILKLLIDGLDQLQGQ